MTKAKTQDMHSMHDSQHLKHHLDVYLTLTFVFTNQDLLFQLLSEPKALNLPGSKFFKYNQQSTLFFQRTYLPAIRIEGSNLHPSSGQVST